jgi:hypothetical protein
VLQELAHVWNDLPEADKGIVTAAALLFGALLLVLVSATLFVST